MTKLFRTTLAALAVMALLPLLAARADDARFPLPSAWMGEHETFVAWYAKQRGWDAEEGLDLAMMPFESGRNIVESLAPLDWAVAGCGAVPVLTVPPGDYLYIVAVANDESAGNALYARPDSPLLKVRGNSPAHPDVHGSAVAADGVEVLCPVGTSAQYLLESWLQILGLSEKDVKVRDMAPSAALSAFNGGDGDLVALWAPLTYEAAEKGYRVVATSEDCGVRQLVLLVANRRFADENPGRVEAFLRMYMRGLEAVRSVPPETLAPEYARFCKEWAGADLTPEEAAADIRSHRIYTLDEQLRMFEPGGELQKTIDAIVDFTLRHGTYSREQIDVMKANRVTSKFLEAVRP